MSAMLSIFKYNYDRSCGFNLKEEGVMKHRALVSKVSHRHLAQLPLSYDLLSSLAMNCAKGVISPVVDAPSSASMYSFLRATGITVHG